MTTWHDNNYKQQRQYNDNNNNNKLMFEKYKSYFQNTCPEALHLKKNNSLHVKKNTLLLFFF